MPENNTSMVDIDTSTHTVTITNVRVIGTLRVSFGQNEMVVSGGAVISRVGGGGSSNAVAGGGGGSSNQVGGGGGGGAGGVGRWDSVTYPSSGSAGGSVGPQTIRSPDEEVNNEVNLPEVLPGDVWERNGVLYFARTRAGGLKLDLIPEIISPRGQSRLFSTAFPNAASIRMFFSRYNPQLRYRRPR